MKSSFALVLLVSFLLIGAAVTQTAPGGQSYCSSKCAARCEKSGRAKLCLRYCGICCGKCNCVPSGTAGNKFECPCYANILNSKGKSKCP